MVVLFTTQKNALLNRHQQQQTSKGNLPPLTRYERLKYTAIGGFYGKLYDFIDRYPRLDPAVLLHKEAPKPSKPRAANPSRRRGKGHQMPCHVMLKLFHSETLMFDEENCVEFAAEILEGGRFCASFNLPNSRRYLRLDIGSYFAQYANPKLKISRIKKAKLRDEKLLVLSDCFDKHHNRQILLKNDQLIAGCDPGVTFENPFAGSDVLLQFDASVLYGFMCIDNLAGTTVIDEDLHAQFEEISEVLFDRVKSYSDLEPIASERQGSAALSVS